MVCMVVLNTVHFTEVVVGGTEDLLADMEAAAAAAAAAAITPTDEGESFISKFKPSPLL